jgi:ankyrin repeat protein
MEQQQQNQLLQQQIQQLQEVAQQQQEQIEELEEEVQQLQQLEPDSDDDNDDEDEEDDDPLVMTYDGAMYSACREGDVETIVSLLDAGKNVNCVSAAGGMTPIMVALGKGRLNAAIELSFEIILHHTL